MTDADVDGSHIQTLLLTFFLDGFQDQLLKMDILYYSIPLYRYKRPKKGNLFKMVLGFYLLIENGLIILL